MSSRSSSATYLFACITTQTDRQTLHANSFASVQHRIASCSYAIKYRNAAKVDRSIHRSHSRSCYKYNHSSPHLRDKGLFAQRATCRTDRDGTVSDRGIFLDDHSRIHFDQSINQSHLNLDSPEIPRGLKGDAGSTDCANEFSALFIIGVDDPSGPCGNIGKFGNMLSGCGGGWPRFCTKFIPCGMYIGGLACAMDEGPLLDLGVKSKAPIELSERAGDAWIRDAGGLPGVDPRSPFSVLLERGLSWDLFMPDALSCEAIEVMVRIWFSICCCRAISDCGFEACSLKLLLLSSSKSSSCSIISSS